MRKVAKPYLINMTEVERAFVEEMAWRRRQKLSEYFRNLIHADMKDKPDVVKAAAERIGYSENQ